MIHSQMILFYEMANIASIAVNGEAANPPSHIYKINSKYVIAHLETCKSGKNSGCTLEIDFTYKQIQIEPCMTECFVSSERFGGGRIVVWCCFSQESFLVSVRETLNTLGS